MTPSELASSPSEVNTTLAGGPMAPSVVDGVDVKTGKTESPAEVVGEEREGGNWDAAD